MRFIFTELDQDGSGKIEKLEFLRGFQDTVQHGESHGKGLEILFQVLKFILGLNGMQRRASVAVEDPPMFLRDEQMFDSESDSTSSRPAIRVFDEEHYHSESDTNINIDFSVPW